HSVAAHVDTVQEPVDAHRDGVRKRDESLAKRAHKCSVGLEDQDRMVLATRAIAASEHIHAVVGPDADARHVAEGPAVGHLRPVFYLTERPPARAAQRRAQALITYTCHECAAMSI